MKICLIGPTYPFRGPIARYTALLCRALRRNHDVKFISFRRQYPRILFPGQSDKDPIREPLKVDHVDYILDSMNPLTWIEIFHSINVYKPDRIIIHSREETLKLKDLLGNDINAITAFQGLTHSKQ